MFGKYLLLEPLGRGATTHAYRAKSIGVEGFEKPVVTWRVRPELMGDAQLVDELMREAKRAATLSHANIAQVLDVGIEEHVCFIATEYVSGKSLSSFVNAGRLSWTVAIHIAIHVAKALDYAHRRRSADGRLLGIVHGSVSPHRILLSSVGDVKLTGFGTAPGGVWPSTEHGAAYRSPEQLRGEPVDGRSDVFSLAVVLRETLSERDAPAQVFEIVDRALERYPEQRITADQLREELERALHASGQWVTSEDVAAVVRGSENEASDQPPTVSGLRAPAGRRRRAGLGVRASARRLQTSRVRLLEAVDHLESRGALFAAIEHLEAALSSSPPRRSDDAEAALALYERLGRLCLSAHVGERGAAPMIAGVDLAGAVGRDDYAAVFYEILGALLAQAGRDDESREWLERARGLEGRRATSLGA